MTGFVFRLIPPRPDFASTMSDDERAIMMEHLGYWSELLAQGRVLAFGPVDDEAGEYGIGIVLAEDMTEAEAIRDEDPTMTSSFGFRTDISPMRRLVSPAGSFDA